MKISRRAFLLGAVFLGVGGAPLAYRHFRRLENDAETVVRALCDLFVPGHGDVPGAVALGIDRLVVDAFRETRRGRLQLLLLSQDLADVDFLHRPADDQRAFVRGELEHAAAGGAPPRRAAAIDKAYRECVQRYLTSPDAWTAIHYRTPQPHGYPDYAECVAS